MKSRLSAIQAWLALTAGTSGEVAGTEQIWQQLLTQDDACAASLETHLSYLCLLLIQQRHLEACAVLQKLFELSGDSCFLKLLSELALEQPRARTPEQPAFSPDQHGQVARQSYTRARSYLARDDWPEALRQAESGLRHARQSQRPELELQAHWLMADLMIARQDLSKAKVCYRAAERILAQLSA